MTHFLSLLLSLSPLWAQNPDSRFGRYCNEIAAPIPSQTQNNKHQVANLMDVVDATNNVNRLMKEALERNLDYRQFKAEMAAKKIQLNDQFHENKYALAARTKCDEIVTEGGPGQVDTAAHTSPTDGQLDRRVDDSGIGVSSPGDGNSTGPSESGR